MPEAVAFPPHADPARPPRSGVRQFDRSAPYRCPRARACSRRPCFDRRDRQTRNRQFERRGGDAHSVVARLADEAARWCGAQPPKRRRVRDAADSNPEGTAVSDALRALSALEPAVAGLAIYPDDFQVVADGVRRRYKAARQAFAEAFATGHDEDFHDWRKGVQHHWRHMQLLAPSWPAVLNARVEDSRALSQILGDDHDIALLSRLISTPTMVFGTPDDTESFLQRCRKRQKALRREAQARGERLFAERPRAFVEHIEEHWR